MIETHASFTLVLVPQNPTSAWVGRPPKFTGSTCEALPILIWNLHEETNSHTQKNTCKKKSWHHHKQLHLHQKMTQTSTTAFKHNGKPYNSTIDISSFHPVLGGQGTGECQLIGCLSPGFVEVKSIGSNQIQISLNQIKCQCVCVNILLHIYLYTT